MKKKCPACNVINFPNANECVRCKESLTGTEKYSIAKAAIGSRLLSRVVVCIFVCIAAIFGFYLSLMVSARSLSNEQRIEVRKAIAVLNDRGFSKDIFL